MHVAAMNDDLMKVTVMKVKAAGEDTNRALQIYHKICNARSVKAAALVKAALVKLVLEAMLKCRCMKA